MSTIQKHAIPLSIIGGSMFVNVMSSTCKDTLIIGSVCSLAKETSSMTSFTTLGAMIIYYGSYYYEKLDLLIKKFTN